MLRTARAATLAAAAPRYRIADVYPSAAGEDDRDDYTADLAVGDADLARPEEERETLQAKNARLQKQLEVRQLD